MRSLTERRWLVMPRKIWVLCYTPHERCTCDRIFCKKVKNRNSYLRSIFEEKNMNISYLYLPHLPGRGEQCNGEHDRQPLYPRTSTTLVTENCFVYGLLIKICLFSFMAKGSHKNVINIFSYCMPTPPSLPPLPPLTVFHILLLLLCFQFFGT